MTSIIAKLVLKPKKLIPLLKNVSVKTAEHLFMEDPVPGDVTNAAEKRKKKMLRNTDAQEPTGHLEVPTNV